MPFAVAVLIAVVALYILQFLRKELEMPHREIIQTKAFLPSWTKMKEIEGHHLTPSMQEPTCKEFCA
ncbi:hypothetical protein EON65_22935 [archaeon]|nr:MAG: hypothetical protein EON65_22935 [archaeon]